MVHNPGGGCGKRWMLKKLECKILKKTARFLYIVENSDNQLCFAISLAHLLHPEMNYFEAGVRGTAIQNKVGLSVLIPVTFSIHLRKDIRNLERGFEPSAL